MNDHFKAITLQATEAKNLIIKEEIQSLWSGYGSIVRLKLMESTIESVVAKHVKMPTNNKHPRGWNTDFSHLRKVKSYEVETNWYKNYASYCNNFCKVPDIIITEQNNDETFMVMEDLDASGYDKRLSTVSWTEIETCLNWLANFHAIFLNKKADDLWHIGTYWHLATRPDELKALDDQQLKAAAPIIDNKLNNAKYLTLVHGDAKLANFCFNHNGTKVAAVDFQYVGGGCGMKDVAYFIGSCLHEEDCELYESKILNTYFKALKNAISRLNTPIDAEALEKEWRELYAFAWTDFHRFLKGWSPDHWKINSYSEKLTRGVINSINKKH